MNDVLVTLATFGDTVEANLAKNYLEAAGIRAFLADEETVNMDWLLGNAVGRIKLQVGDGDEEAARTLLSEHGHIEAPAPLGPDEIRYEDSSPAGLAPDRDDSEEDHEDDDYEPAPTARDQNATRAFRGAIFGVLFFPLQFYVFYLLLRVFISDEPLGDRERRKAIVAAIINLPFVIGLCVMLRMMLS
jgi:Putative prokaryotic signal transducing protein